MRTRLAIALTLGAFVCPLIASAQEAPPTAARAIYYKCDQSKESRTDEIIEQFMGPVFDRYLAEGKINNWGWLVHSVGGEWRRAVYWGAEDVGSLLDVTDQLVEELQRDHGAALEELNSICPTHDDYIWLSSVGSDTTIVGTDRAPAGLSVYFECDMSREERADEIVSDVFGPIANQAVADGKVHSWSWIVHSVGGTIRRALIWDGADHKTILSTREMLVADWRSASEETYQEFLQICPTHHDYLWDIAIANP